MAKRIWLWILMLLFVLMANRSSYLRVFTEKPRSFSYWEVTNVWNNRIGDKIKANLIVVTSQGVEVDLSRLPDVGDIWELPDKEKPIPPDDLAGSVSLGIPHHDGDSLSMIDEGMVEVRSREIEVLYKGDKVYTVVSYELQYLLPVEWEVAFDDKRLPIFVPVITYYNYYDAESRIYEKRISLLDYNTETIYLYHRVDENSLPMFDPPYKVEAPISPWRHGETVGLGLIGLAMLLIVRRCMLLMQMVLVSPPEEEREKELTISDYFKSWEQDHQYETFIKAVLLFNKIQRPKNDLWWRTMVVLYSGFIFDEKYIRNLFNEMLKEE